MFCANTSQAKERVERANLTLQDRLVKELRLRKISTREAANEFAPHFMADYNARFGKAARSPFDAHRPLREDEELGEIFTWRVQRKVSQSLTLQHERQIYLLADTPANRKLIHRHIDIWEYPDGRLNIQADGRVLAYERYDRLATVDAAAIVENKRLGHALQVAQLLQLQRDDRRHMATSRTHRGEPANLNNLEQRPGTKAQRALSIEDLEAAIGQASKPLPPFKLRSATAVSAR